MGSGSKITRGPVRTTFFYTSHGPANTTVLMVTRLHSDHLQGPGRVDLHWNGIWRIAADLLRLGRRWGPFPDV